MNESKEILGMIFNDYENDMVVRAIDENRWESYSIELWKDAIMALPSGSVVWDVGAYTGFYAMLAAKLRQDIKIVAFEPHPNNFKTLCINILSNKFDNIIPLNIALSESGTLSTINLLITNDILMPSGSSIVDIDKTVLNSIEITAIAGDKLITDSTQSPNLIKIDVEGAERQVLNGIRHIVDTVRPTILIELLDESDAKYARNYFTSYGYMLDRINETSKTMDGPYQDTDRNFLCTHVIS